MLLRVLLGKTVFFVLDWLKFLSMLRKRVSNLFPSKEIGSKLLRRWELRRRTRFFRDWKKEGFVESDATADMVLALDKVWSLLIDCEMVNGKEKPPVRAFTTVMSGEAQTYGIYKNGMVWIHTDLSVMSGMLLKVMLEEVVHHTTQASDLSRDLQDYLFRMIVKMWF